MPSPWLRFSVLPLLLTGHAFSQCDPSATVKQTLDAYSAANREPGTDAEKKAAKSRILETALAADPTDFFLLDRERDLLDENTSASREASIAYFAALHQRYPDSPAVTAVYADVLRAQDSPQSLALLEASQKAHPDFPWTPFKKFQIFESGKLRNKERMGEEIDAYLRICPAPSSPLIYLVLSRNGSPEQITKNAPLLRTRLESETGPPNQNLWRALWDLEFKAVPPSGHAAVRERIGKDLAQFEAAPQPAQASPSQVAWLSFLSAGYTNTGNAAAIARINNQILKEFPNSHEAEGIVTGQWRKDHPFPTDQNKATLQAWYRASAAASADWYERWHGLIWLMQQFSAVAALDDTKPADLLALAEKYVQAYHANPNAFYGAMPMEYAVAEALIRKNVLPGAIPDWVDEGYRRETNRPSRSLGFLRDQMSDEQKRNADGQIDTMRVDRARILLDYYDAVGQPAKSRAIDDQLSGIHPTDDRLKPALFEVRAKAAEMDNRKLDALILYQSARNLGGKQRLRGTTDSLDLDAKIDHLWKDLGGTPANLPLFTGKTKLEPVSTMRWETPRNPLPPFTLTDLEGKTWKLANLNGKATLINVWATWCGPCVAEHPEFQKLYEKLKDRKDIAMLTLNVDDEAGLIAPYMTEKHYTFPVLLGNWLLEAVSGESGITIPQNWLVTPAAKLESLQIGYGGEPQWQSMMIEKLEKMLNR
jgi:thiol-disulfide isomerase/thioredoxin